MQEGATTAPPLLTEADLIALMEKHGIGTDATHAEHINTIKERGYIGVVDKGCLVPGIIGMGLYEGYDAMDLALAKPMLRAAFESDLKDISTGKKNPKTVLNEQIQKYLEAYKQITEKVTAMDNKMSLRINETPATNESQRSDGGNITRELFQCPKCSVAPLSLRQKKNQNSYYIGCMNFPDCKNTIWLSEECLEPKVLSETCQRCGPNVKLIKLKFASMYYKTLFKTPSGWYKTCFRCDQQFQDNFNINLDQVKRTGGIVGTATQDSNTITAGVALSAAFRNSETIRGSECPRNINENRNMSKSKSNTETKQLPLKKKTKSTTQSVRTYFTVASEQTLIDQSSVPMDIESSVVPDLTLDNFFNDGFDEVMCAVDIQTETATNTTNIPARNAINERASVGSDSFRSINKCTSGSVKSTNSNFDECFPDLNDFIWGTSGHKIRSLNGNEYKSSQNLQSKNQDVRTRLSKTDQYNWDNKTQHNVAPTTNIQCCGCHQKAKQHDRISVSGFSKQKQRNLSNKKVSSSDDLPNDIHGQIKSDFKKCD
ncbi:DNA topoisomerase 3-alpha [Rhagoletis pomonella]|uniref:DNA topoisomerase 3-alpha n=1 Tax=Rhagoletis pomonella TaxID=28610 RepID=UPI0017812709|nr:DNA topoisomerase 3-alpha [Rhagoletis pomonella]